MKTVLRMTGLQHSKLKSHLFPGDNLEAVAIALCGRHKGKDLDILTVKEIYPIPYENCSVRTQQRVSWSTEILVPILEKAQRTNAALIKIHSHPGGFSMFSETDDFSDRTLFDSVYAWFEDDDVHGSCIMLPGGKMFGRVVLPDGQFGNISRISVAGDDIYFWNSDRDEKGIPEFAKRHAQAFGAGTFDILRQLSIAVIGCSGTGSIVIEQLARLGVGKLVIVDPDRIEEKNLNRILNAFEANARSESLKVEILAEAVNKMGTGTEVIGLPLNLYNSEAVKLVSECDVVFGCVDTVEGRHLLNRLAVFYNIPFIDVGVRLVADGKGGVDQICGSVNYIQPDRSSLLSRGLYSINKLYAESLKRTNPGEYEKQLKEKYISGVQEDRPAVISVNMQFAAMAVNEFLARIHKFRDDGNEEYAVTRFSLTQNQYYFEQEEDACKALSRHVGRGDVTPLLDMPELSVGNN